MSSATIDEISMNERTQSCTLTVSPVFAQFVDSDLLPTIGVSLVASLRHNASRPCNDRAHGDLATGGGSLCFLQRDIHVSAKNHAYVMPVVAELGKIGSRQSRHHWQINCMAGASPLEEGA